MKTRYFLICAALIAASVAANLVAWPHLPETIPVHWDAHGHVDRYGSRMSLWLLGPGLMTFSTALFAVLPWFSPKRFEIGTFESAYLRLMLIVVTMMGYVFAVVLWAVLGDGLDLTRAMLGGIAVFIALIGNLMGKVRRNFFVGVRTPWTLASERVWYATHRLAGKMMVGAGLVCAIGAFAGVPVWLWIGVMMAGTLTPVVYSLVYYKRLEREGTLEAR